MKSKYDWVTKEFLEHEHITLGKTQIQVGKDYNIPSGTIKYLYKKYKVKTLSRAETNKKLYSKLIPKEVLYQKYVIEHKSMTTCGLELKCSPAFVLEKLREYNIPSKLRKAYGPPWNKGLDKNDPRVKAKSKKQGITLKNRVKNDIELKNKFLKNLDKANRNIKRSRTKPEIEVEAILNKLNLTDFKYTGDGSYWIKRFNPDFVNELDKKVIEVFGDYWHGLPNYIERDKKRLAIYNKEGWQCLVIWQSDLSNEDNVISAVSSFTRS